MYSIDGEGGAHCVSKRVGMCPLCHKMRRYGPTVQVREDLRLHSLCIVAGKACAHFVRN